MLRTVSRVRVLFAAALALGFTGCCFEDGDCETGLFCTTGRCLSFRCVEEARDCSDGVDCTTDSCDESGAACLNAPDDGACDDGLFCTGQERCDPSTGCEDGTPPECSDGVDCTSDLCDESIDACTSIPDDAFCDDGLYCDGEEHCDPGAGCLPGAPPECVDGVACTIDRCDESADACRFDPDDASCDDGVACTHDACDLVTGCASTPDDALCDDGDPCNGGETCDLSTGCQPGVPVVCDDGLFCNGLETCSPATGECHPGTPPSCDDGLDCTTDRCIETTDSCSHTPEHALCDDALFCNGTESCSLVTGCRDGPPPDCTSEDDCHEGVCDESRDACDSTPLTDTLCDAGSGPGSGICHDGVCFFRGCGDGFLEPGPVPPGEECDPGPDFVETPGCSAECRSIDFRVSDLLPATGWNGAQQLAPQGSPLATLGDERFVVVWTRDIGDECGGPLWGDGYCSTDVEARIFDRTGEPDGAVIRVHDAADGAQQQAVVAPLGGGFVVFWTGDLLSAGARGHLFARAFDELGAPLGGERQVDRQEGFAQLHPSAAALDDGVVVVWEGRGSVADTAIFLHWLDERGVPEGADDEVVALEAWERLSAPQVAVSSDGAVALVAWHEAPGDWWVDDRIMGRFYDVATGSAVGAELELAAAEPGVAHDVHSLTALPEPDNGFFLLWRRFEGGALSLEGRRVSPDGTLGDVGEVAGATTGSSYEQPSATAFADGRLALAWGDDRVPSEPWADE